jgi:4-hydroxy-3-methylbut-2-enyl diphosphate reductase
VIGGKKSSNSSHLVELCEEKLPTYFIESEEDILSEQVIKAFNWRTHEEYRKENYLPEKKEISILITSGASCPDAIVEMVIQKIAGYLTDPEKLEEVSVQWQ